MRGWRECLEAGAIVTGAGVTTRARGCTVAKVAGPLGTYDVTLDKPIGAADAMIMVNIREALGGLLGTENVQCVRVADNTYRVTTYRIAVLTDLGFNITFFRRAHMAPGEAMEACVNGQAGAFNSKGGLGGNTGAGLNTLTFDHPIGPADGFILASTAAAGGNRDVSVNHPAGGLTALLNGFNAGAAADFDIRAMAFRITPGLKIGSLEAGGRFDGITPAVICQVNCTVASLGAGAYQITLARPLDPADCVAHASIDQPGLWHVMLNPSSATTIDVFVFDATGAPAQGNRVMDFGIFRIS